MYEEKKPFNVALRLIIPPAIALIYGGCSWFFFYVVESKYFPAEIVSWSFIAGIPFVMGGLTTLIGFKLDRPSYYWTLAAPSLTTLLGLILSFITQLEALLCVIVALPIMLVFGFLGGVIVGTLLTKINKKLPVTFIVFIPFLTPYAEQLWEQPQEMVTIQDQVIIKAAPSVIWEHIASVDEIRKEELPFQWIYHLDFPRPLSAVIDKHEVGGIRLAMFERDVTFFEKVTVWEENEVLSFSIHADPDFVPKSAFDQHIIVGGRFYDVLDGTYRIEQKGDYCILHLESVHRLSSPFNKYAGWWSEWVMNQIQGSILEVIKNRCESATVEIH